MFNSLSPHVAAAVARCMGLSLDNIRDLTLQILRARGVWRLPSNCEPEVIVNSRGLLQGMASSVLLAEVAISPLLWRLSLHDPTLSMWSYVDDLNLCADSIPKLLEAWAYIQEFALDFSVSIARHKCSVWTNSKRQRMEVQQETGLQVTDSFQALGGEWALTRSAKLTYPKEMKRLQECMKRLERARYLPIKPEKLVAIVSVGCLSLLDFVNSPSHLHYKQVAGAVKACFKVTTGAPEVIFNVLTMSTLDPLVRWLLSGLRLWFFALSEEPTPQWVLRVCRRSSGRLGASARMAQRWEIEVTPRGLLVGERLVRPT